MVGFVWFRFANYSKPIHITIVLRVIERKNSLEYSVPVVVLTIKERQFSLEGDKLFFVFVIPKAIAGSHRDSATQEDI